RQVLSGLASPPIGNPLTAVTTPLLGQSPQSETTIVTLDLTRASGKTVSNAPQGLLDVGVRVNVGLPGLLDVQAGVNLALGEETQGATLAASAAAAVSLGGSATGSEGQTGSSSILGLALNTSAEIASIGQRTGPLLNLSLSLNSPAGSDMGSGGTS